MKHRMKYIFLFLCIFVLVLGCSKKDNNVEVNVDGDSTSIRIKGEGDEFTLEERASIPDGFPEDVPIYPELDIYASVSEDKDDTFSIQGRTSDNMAQVARFYKMRLDDDGWEEKMAMTTSQVIMLGYEKDVRIINLVLSQNNEGTDLNITIGRREE